jgi:DTW domain-containing protein YfiP
VPIGTARMAHLSLVGSRLVEGVHFDDDPRVADLFAGDDSTAILFPDDSARPFEAWQARPPKRLVVLDGTWSQAKKLLTSNPRLGALPKLSFQPAEPGRYRIRKEPTDQHLSTIEATAAVLGALEGDVDAYRALLQPFDAMVETQLGFLDRAGREPSGSASRHSSRTTRRGTRADRRFEELRPLLLRPQRLVVVYAEANAHPRAVRDAGAPELLHLVACRPLIDSSSDVSARLDVRVKPIRSLHDTVLERLGLERQDLEGGVGVDVALGQFRAFLGDGRLVCWGAFARDLLVQAGDSHRGFVDLRALSCRALGGPAGGLDNAALRLGVTPSSASTRADRMLDDASGVVRALAVQAAHDDVRPGEGVA